MECSEFEDGEIISIKMVLGILQSRSINEQRRILRYCLDKISEGVI